MLHWSHIFHPAHSELDINANYLKVEPPGMLHWNENMLIRGLSNIRGESFNYSHLAYGYFTTDLNAIVRQQTLMYTGGVDEYHLINIQQKVYHSKSF